ncbi:MAG: aminoacetone oxidase family FAD-binding enzyme [Clostridiales bacterium]|nr:aminoacetone oxidase family FAD-binding enzyme [Clostridiales bacterium]
MKPVEAEKQKQIFEDACLYDVIIVGAGAAGLMCAASPAWRAGGKRLILESGKRPGLKLLMSGGGHCNITHEGSMRDLLPAYGPAGKTLRACLYKYGNLDSKAFLERAGVPLYADETGRVLPVSMKAQDVLDAYLAAVQKNGFAFRYGQKVHAVSVSLCGGTFDGNTQNIQEETYCIHTESQVFRCRTLILATGGCSYPATGSDGSMFRTLQRDLAVAVTPLAPALVPVIPEAYPYADLAGITLPRVRVSIHREGRKSIHKEGALLFTHTSFSGPCALDISGHAVPGSRIALNYLYPMAFDEAYAAVRAQGMRTGKAVAEAFSLPKRLASLLVQRAADSPKKLARLLTEDTFPVAGTEGFRTAMVTKGGVCLSEVDSKTMALKNHSQIYVIGEALDADGISGGYNLQLCWSTAQAAAYAAAED